MKTDPKALFWGTVIAVAFVAAAMVQVFEFPHFRLPFTWGQGEIFVVGSFLFGIVVAAYKRLWKRLSFWALLFGFLGAHIALYWVLVANIADSLGGVRLAVFYGVVSAVEFFAFALIVARLFHQGPNVPSWIV